MAGFIPVGLLLLVVLGFTAEMTRPDPQTRVQRAELRAARQPKPAVVPA